MNAVSRLIPSGGIFIGKVQEDTQEETKSIPDRRNSSLSYGAKKREKPEEQEKNRQKECIIFETKGSLSSFGKK